MKANPWLEWDTHPLSDELKQVIQRLQEDADAIVEEVFRGCLAAIPAYGTPEVLAHQDSVKASIRYSVTTLHQALLEARSPLTQEAFRTVSQHVGERMVQNVGASDLLLARQLGGRVHWAYLLDAVQSSPALQEEVLQRVSPNMLRYLDAHYQMGFRMFATERRERFRWRETVRSELCALLLSGSEDHEAFHSRAQVLMLDDTAPFCVLALKLTPSGGGSWNDADLREDVVESIARLLESDAEGLLRVTYHGYLLVWLPVPRSENAFGNDRRLADLASRLAERERPVAAVGIGLPGLGVRGWSQSARQAIKAIESGVRNDAVAPVYHYSDIALDDAVARSDNTLRYFESLLARLAAEPNLLQTLRTYFELRQHRKTVASALGIHPNTLDYRLDRIQGLLGASLDSAAWIAKLQVALRLRGVPEGERVDSP